MKARVMIQPAARNGMGRVLAALDVLFGRLIGIAAGPELRVSFAISQAAKRARRKYGDGGDTTPQASGSMLERSGEW